MSEGLELAREHHRNLPAHVREYLQQARGISPEIIDLHLLGWNGTRITIPIFDRAGQFSFFKLAKAPNDQTDSPKMLVTPGHAELYGWDRVLANPERIILCEGEFGRLALESRGFAAVTSTGGALTFRLTWAEAFREIPQVYICFDNDGPGLAGAERVARLIPHARLVCLPEEVGDGGDVTDFFVRLGRSREDFVGLLDAAQPLPEEQRGTKPAAMRPQGSAPTNNEVERLKRSVAIEDLVARYVELYTSGQNYRARCPFHDDRNPSFVVYAQTQTFYCFGCREHGDVLSFLMRQERLTFPEALNALRELHGGETRRDN